MTINRRTSASVKKRKPHTSRAVKASLDRRYIGDEPIDVWEKGYTQALNWYNDSCEPEDARSWLIKYMTNNQYPEKDIALVNAADIKFIPTTIGWVAKMLINGNLLNQSSYDYFDSRLETLLKRTESDIASTNSTPTNYVSVKVRTENKTDQIITEIEEQLDLQGKDFSLYQYLQNRQLTPTIVGAIKRHYKPFLEELMDDSDPDIKEAFGKNLADERLFWFNFISNCNKFLPIKKNQKAKTRDRVSFIHHTVGN